MVPVKRLELLIAGLAELGNREPATRIHWTHIGDGPLARQLRNAAARTFPSNVAYQFLGQVDNKGVFDYYRHHPVDAFVNVSASEGVPVSIMEAQSCGIPVVATSVGGVPEIVNDENGILLPRDVTAEDLSEVLRTTVHMRDRMADKRRASKAMWRQRYNARLNYSQFVNEIAG
jgi:glycosyltransferase involved in cell wall biosynthesis